VSRVCIVSTRLPPRYGGAEIAAWRYAHRLERAGSDVVLLAPVPPNFATQSDLPEWVSTVGRWGKNPARRAGIARRPPGIGLLSMAAPLWRQMVALRDRFDVVHIFNGRPLFNLLALPAARVLGKPSIVEMSLLGSDDPLTLRQAAGEPGDAFSSRLPVRFWLYRLADRYVTKSAPLTEAYMRSGLPEGKLRHVPYAVDTELFAPPTPSEREGLRSRLGLGADEAVILFVGGINPRKGVHRLVGAFRRVVESYGHARLLVVGPASKYGSAYLDGLTSDVRRWGIGERVRFVPGFSDNVHEYMRAADVFVLPSEREGLPISVLEAMSCGLAVVASDIPEVAGAEIEPEREGLLVPVGDEAALTEALSRTLGDEALRRRLGSAARARVEREFSEPVVDRRYRELYAELTRARSGTVPETTEAVDATSIPKRMRGEA
jgi:glycosyltransferase involved in cell wall biosynthesis